MDYKVYLLVSINNRTYIGTTNDITKRLQAHNGLIKGGAKATRAHRPWKYVCIIDGFTKTNALSFEWYAKHIKRNNKYYRLSGLDNRINNIKTLLKLPIWENKKLSIVWY